MEENANLAEDHPDDLLSDILCFAEMFERLSPDAKAEVLELLRRLNGTN